MYKISIPNWELSPNRTPIEFSRIVVPTTVLLKDDCADFAQEERRDLPYWIMIYAICVVEDEPNCLDIPILDFFQ